MNEYLNTPDNPNIPNIDDLPRKLRSEQYISKHYPDLYSVLQSYPEELSFGEKMYWFYNKIENYPTCPVCGKPVKFINSTKGYHKFCCTKCSNNSKEVKDKKKQSCQENYGTDNPLKNKEILQKRNDTILKRYGVKNISELDSIKEKKRQTNMSKTGAPCSFLAKSPYIIDFVPNENGEYKYKCPHPDTCNKCSEKWFLITPVQHCVRVEFQTETCTRLLPYNKMSKNNSLELFIKRLLDKHNIDYEEHNRSILNGQEIDIFVPSKNIAIECNGVFWHSAEFKDKTYHYDKWKKCKDKGVQLLSVWEDEIKTRPEIIESLILSKLGVYENKVGARECELRKVSSKESTEFLIHNHLQGIVTSSIRLGLYYHDELVSLMTFGKQRKCMNGDLNKWELHRFCNKRGWQVIGGASKLFKHFLDTCDPSSSIISIISFSSNDISNGHLYESLGFVKESEQKYSYWYIDRNTFKRRHRYSFNKKYLVKRGADPSLTEFQIMSSTNYLRVYDSGQQKWIYETRKDF